MKDYLIVSEMFYSIQGEGKSLGTPAVFLRLAACNLTCSGFSYKDPATGEHVGCDTGLVWRKGERWTFTEIFSHWEQQGWLDALRAGAHLVITGGEPLLQQTRLWEFIQALDQQLTCFIEIETNATILFTTELLQRINQINASPKLSHAGDAVEKRFQLDVLQQLAANEKTCFKFVLAEPENIEEILQSYVLPLKIAAQHVWLMPEGGTREAMQNKSAWLVDLCKKHYFHFTPRLHIDIWGEVTGV